MSKEMQSVMDAITAEAKRHGMKADFLTGLLLAKVMAVQFVSTPLKNSCIIEVTIDVAVHPNQIARAAVQQALAKMKKV